MLMIDHCLMSLSSFWEKKTLKLYNILSWLGECNMWTTVHVVSGLDNAKKIENKLNKEGFLVKINLFSKEGDEELYEILVPEVEAEDVQQVLLLDMDIM